MIQPPKPKTLARYGLHLADWALLLASQGGACAVCKRVPENRRLVIDHVHAPKWRKKPPEERRRYVRGLVCAHDNHRLLGRFVTLSKARAVVEYLERYEQRKEQSR